MKCQCALPDTTECCPHTKHLAERMLRIQQHYSVSLLFPCSHTSFTAGQLATRGYQNHKRPKNQPKAQDTGTDFPPYLTENIFDIRSAQLTPPWIDGIHDLLVLCRDAGVSLLVTAAKVFIGRAELQVNRGLERRPIIQALRVPQETAYPA